MSNKYFQLEGLSVGYNGQTLIKDICIDIKKGEIVTLIGPNGAGKSTILKTITKQLQLINGRVIFDLDNLKNMTYQKLAE